MIQRRLLALQHCFCHVTAWNLSFISAMTQIGPTTVSISKWSETVMYSKESPTNETLSWVITKTKAPAGKRSSPLKWLTSRGNFPQDHSVNTIIMDNSFTAISDVTEMTSLATLGKTRGQLNSRPKSSKKHFQANACDGGQSLGTESTWISWSCDHCPYGYEYQRTGMSSLMASATRGLAARINRFLGANKAEMHVFDNMQEGEDFFGLGNEDTVPANESLLWQLACSGCNLSYRLLAVFQDGITFWIISLQLKHHQHITQMKPGTTQLMMILQVCSNCIIRTWIAYQEMRYS